MKGSSKLKDIVVFTMLLSLVFILVGCTQTKTKPESVALTEHSSTTGASFSSSDIGTDKEEDDSKAFTDLYVPKPIKYDGEYYEAPKNGYDELVGYYSGQIVESTSDTDKLTKNIQLALTEDGYYTLFKEYINTWDGDATRYRYDLNTGILHQKFNGFSLLPLIDNYPGDFSGNLVNLKNDTDGTDNLVPVGWYTNESISFYYDYFHNSKHVVLSENSMETYEVSKADRVDLVVNDDGTLTFDGVLLHKTSTPPKYVQKSAFQYYYNKVPEIANMSLDSKQDVLNYLTVNLGWSAFLSEQEQNDKFNQEYEQKFEGKVGYLENGEKVELKYVVYRGRYFASDGEEIYSLEEDQNGSILLEALNTYYDQVYEFIK